MKHRRKPVKQFMSWFLILAMLLPNISPIIAEASTALSNMPRRVSFTRPTALTLDELGLATGSEAGRDDITDEDGQNQPADPSEDPTLIEEETDPEIPVTDEGLRQPEQLYEEIIEEPEGTLVQFSDSCRTYEVGEKEYITVIGGYSGLFRDKDGKVKKVDHTLVLSDQTTEDEDGIPASASNAYRRSRGAVPFENASGPVNIRIPQRMSTTRGVSIETDKGRLELIPTAGNFTHPSVAGNAVRFNDVFENVDYQYTLVENSVKGDIFLLEKGERNEFSYKLKIPGLKARQDGKRIAIYKAEDEAPLFILDAPYMEDDSGERSTKIKFQLSGREGSYEITITADKKWLNDEERSYPVRIDPSAGVPSDEFIFCPVSEGEPNVHYDWDSTPYVGYLGGTRKNNRVYAGFNMDNNVNITSILEGATECIEANLKITTETDNSGGLNTIQLGLTTESWNAFIVTWNNSPTYEIIDESPAPGINQAMTFDITDRMNKWIRKEEGLSGFVLRSEVEPDATGISDAEVLCNRGDSTNGPKIEMRWEGDLPGGDLADMDVDETTITVEPAVEITDVGGRTVTGVVSHGVTQAGATVTYELVNGSEERDTIAEDSLIYPEFPDGLTNDFDITPESNWQTDGYVSGEDIDFDTIYHFKAYATEAEKEEPEESGDTPGGEGEEGEGDEPKVGKEVETCEFLLYEVQEHDLINRIARHYGVNVNQLARDNHLYRNQLTEKDTVLFIREPKTDKPYSFKELSTLEEKMLKNLLAGSNLNCELGYEPVNLNTGNFYMTQEDAAITDLSGSFGITRSYNSSLPEYHNEFGYGWASRFGEHLTILGDGRIVYKRNDGKGIPFTKDGDRYEAADGYDIRIEPMDEIDIETATPSDAEEETEGTGVTHKVTAKDLNRAATALKNENWFAPLSFIFKGKKPVRVKKAVEKADEFLKELADAAMATPSDAEAPDTALADTEPSGSEPQDYDNVIIYEETDTDPEEREEGGDSGGDKPLAPPDCAGWKLTNADGSISAFDVLGFLQYKEDLKGRRTSYTYDEDYNLLQVKSPTGKLMKFTMDEANRITDIVLPDESTLKYEYDESGNLVSATNSAGDVRRYEYDDKHRMTAWYDEEGNRVIENVYDEENRVIAQTDANGGTATLQYSDGRTTTTDNNGNTSSYFYDEQFRTTRIEYPDGSITKRSYDSDGRPESTTDGLGVTIHYTYDAQGNILSESRGDGAESAYTYNEKNLPLTARDFAGNTTVFTYDEKGNLLTMTDGEGNRTSYRYDEMSRLAALTDGNGNTMSFEYDGAVVTAMTDAEGERWTYDYDVMNRVLAETDPLGHDRTYTYNANGWKTEETEKDGGVTRYEFSPAGAVLSITDAEESRTVFTYDKMHNILSGTDALGNTLTYTYDGNYNRISETDAKGNVTEHIYDGRDRMVQTIDALGSNTLLQPDANGNPVRIADKKGNLTAVEYDKALGVPSSIKDSMGHVTGYEYNRNGQVEEIRYADGSTASYSYDRAGRAVTTTAQNGLVTEIRYDGNGNITAITDDETRVYHFTYDKNNRLVESTDPLGGVTSYEYDAAGNLLTTTDAENHSTGYAYDAMGRLTGLKDALEGTVSMEYDLLGRTTKTTDQNGHGTEAVYDPIGEKLAEVNAAGYVTAYAYDPLGNVTEVTDALKGTNGYTYDALNRTTKATDALGHDYLYEYDANGNPVKITMPDGDTVTMTYDKNNRTATSTDEAGVATSYTYDSMGRIVKASDTTGNVMTYEYDLSGNLVKQTDTIGRNAVYVYDKFNRLISVTGTDGATTAYTYDPLDRLTGVTEADGAVTRYEYDKAGNLIKTTEPGEAVYTYAYDAINRVTGKVDPLGAATSFRYDAKGNLILAADENGVETTYAYDVLDRLTALTDGNGGTTAYEYDELSRLLSVATPEGNRQEYRYDALGNLLKYKDPNSLITEYQYDIMSNLVKDISPKGAETSYTYDKHDELTSVTDTEGNVTAYEVDLNRMVTKLTEKNGGVYTYTYDEVHRLTGITTPLGLIKSFTYDGADNLIKDSDSLGRTTELEYDVMHRMTKAVNAKGGTELYDYDVRGNLSAATNAMGHKNTYVYDLIDQMTQSVDPEGKATRFTYDPAGNLTILQKPGARITNYSYDNNYNVTDMSDPKGYAYKMSYDKDNRRTGSTDPLKQTQSVTYDPGSRITAMTDKMGLDRQFTYDAHGNVLTARETDGRNTRYAYDPLDNLTEVTDPMGGKTRYGYDVMGNITAMTDTKSNTTKYTYDLESNMTSLTSPMGRKEQFTYDAGGRMNSRLTAKGDTIRYDYDTLNGLAEKTYADKDGEETDHPVQMGYNAMGERISMEDITGGSSFTYDSLGRLKTAVSGSGKTIEYAYDEADNLSAILYPDGKEVNYRYDKNDNITELTDRDGRTTVFGYDPLNRVMQIQRPNGIKSTFTYNARNQMMDVANTCRCGFLISSYAYTYDDAGLIVTETAKECLFASDSDYGHQGGAGDPCLHKDENYWQNQNPEWETTKSTFKYDDKGQLLEAKEDKGPFTKITYSYEYDEAGNQTYAEKKELYENARWAEYTYNADNQMTSSRTCDGYWQEEEYTYKYDANGNMTAECLYDYAQTWYLYDTENRLKAAYDGDDILMMAAAYDGDGNRAFQLNYDPDAVCGYGYNYNGQIFAPENRNNADGSLTAEGELFELIEMKTGRTYDLIEYVNDTNRQYTQTLAEYSINGDSRTAYSYAGDMRVSQNRIRKPNDVDTNDVTGYYEYDGRGSVTSVTNCIGMSVEVYQYTPYGQVTLGSTEHKNFYGYNAESYNPNAELEYLRARYYNPNIGRFFREDTYLGDIADPLTLNRYAYVKNSPLNYIDPSGHSAAAVLDVGMSVAGGVSGLDGPAPGLADLAGAIIAGGTLIYAGGVYVVDKISQAKEAKKTKGCETDTEEEKSKGEKTEGDSGTEDTATSNKGNAYDNTPSSNHSTTNGNPIKGEPNSSVDILDKNGNVVRRRWFDSEGDAMRDLDYTNHGNPKTHSEWPHEHIWEGGRSPYGG